MLNGLMLRTIDLEADAEGEVESSDGELLIARAKEVLTQRGMALGILVQACCRLSTLRKLRPASYCLLPAKSRRLHACILDCKSEFLTGVFQRGDLIF